MRIEQQIEELTAEKLRKEAEQPGNLERVLKRVGYFLKHLDELIVQQIDPVKKAQLFGIIFDQTPTVADITLQTPKTPLFPGV